MNKDKLYCMGNNTIFNDTQKLTFDRWKSLLDIKYGFLNTCTIWGLILCKKKCHIVCTFRWLNSWPLATQWKCTPVMWHPTSSAEKHTTTESPAYPEDTWKMSLSVLSIIKLIKLYFFFLMKYIIKLYILKWKKDY